MLSKPHMMPIATACHLLQESTAALGQLSSRGSLRKDLKQPNKLGYGLNCQECSYPAIWFCMFHRFIILLGQMFHNTKWLHNNTPQGECSSFGFPQHPNRLSAWAIIRKSNARLWRFLKPTKLSLKLPNLRFMVSWKEMVGFKNGFQLEVLPNLN